MGLILWKNNWRDQESLEKVIPFSKSLHPYLKWWLEEKMCYKVNHYTHQSMLCRSLRIKRRVGRSQTHWKGNLVPSRKQATHKLSGTKDGLSGPKRVSRPLLEQHSSHSYRQHHSGCLQKQGWDDEVGPSVCPSVVNPDLVFQETGDS